MQAFTCANWILAALLAVCCGYQAVFAATRLLRRGRRFDGARPRRYAVLIAARNEQAVIGQLIDSIRAQEYPAELIDIFVAADNCTDDTAGVAAAHGAAVYQRFDRRQVGKGYALRFLLEHIWRDRPDDAYDGYFVFDADNLLDPGYIGEMNKVFAAGARVVTGCRNAKNFGDNWLTAGYGLYFLRESEFMNRPRDYFGADCVVSGTGFLVADSLLRETGGWRWFALAEDTEFTADMVCRGERIAYCSEAVLFDEQPTDFRVSLVQRTRWIKGYIQVLLKKGPALAGAWLKTGRFSCYEMVFNGLVTAFCGVAGLVVNTLALGAALLSSPQELEVFLKSAVVSGLAGAAASYMILYCTGLLTLLTQWKRIRCSAGKKLLYSLGYPLFMASFLLVLIPAVFGKARWQPIAHTAAVSIGELGENRGKV